MQAPSVLLPAKGSNTAASPPSPPAAGGPETHLVSSRVAAPGEVPARRLRLSEVDEAHRARSPSRRPGYCVDELCTCGQHKCIPSRPSVPFEGNSVYRQEYGPKPLPAP